MPHDCFELPDAREEPHYPAKAVYACEAPVSPSTTPATPTTRGIIRNPRTYAVVTAGRFHK